MLANPPSSEMVAEEYEKLKWLAIRKEAGLKIDPETAKVTWCFQYVFDPYGIDPDLPEEYRQVGREYFARSPGSDIWVWFGDLPVATAKALWDRHQTSLAFPAGLPPVEENDASVIFKGADGNVVVQVSESIKQQAAKEAKQMAKLAAEISKGLL